MADRPNWFALTSLVRFAAFSGLLIAAAFSPFWWPKVWPKPAASQEACVVYQAYYDTVERREMTYLHPVTISAEDRQFSVAPTSFWRETGGNSISEFDGEIFVGPEFERFELSTTTFFAPVASKDEVNIRRCFGGTGSQPNFHGGSLGKFYELHREPDDNDDPTTPTNLITLSPVGFSDDGKYALLYAAHHCGSNCGMRHFALFEMLDGDWQEIGRWQPNGF